jgi:hypothetical protein
MTEKVAIAKRIKNIDIQIIALFGVLWQRWTHMVTGEE